MCPVLGVATGVSSTEGAKEDLSAVAAEIVTVCRLIRQLRVEDCLRMRLRAGGWTGDVMLDEEPAVAVADGLRIGITLRASSSSSSRGIGRVTLGQTTFFSLTGTE